jgi:hypothetical protein
MMYLQSFTEAVCDQDREGDFPEKFKDGLETNDFNESVRIFWRLLRRQSSTNG